MLRQFDWVIITTVFCFSLLSLAALYPYSVINGGSFFLRQLIFFCIGFIVLISLSFVNISFLKKQRVFILGLYLTGILLLGLVFLIGANIRGAQAWLHFLPFLSGKTGFQPSEIMKIILIFILARYLTIQHAYLYKVRNVFTSGLYAWIPASLIALQPDLGSAAVIILLWLSLIHI